MSTSQWPIISLSRMMCLLNDENSPVDLISKGRNWLINGKSGGTAGFRHKWIQKSISLHLWALHLTLFLSLSSQALLSLSLFSFLFLWLRQVFVAAHRISVGLVQDPSLGRLRLVVLCGIQGARPSEVNIGGLSCSEACGILVPRPGIKPAPLELQGEFLTPGPPRKSPDTCH